MGRYHLEASCLKIITTRQCDLSPYLFLNVAGNLVQRHGKNSSCFSNRSTWGYSRRSSSHFLDSQCISLITDYPDHGSACRQGVCFCLGSAGSDKMVFRGSLLRCISTITAATYEFRLARHETSPVKNRNPVLLGSFSKNAAASKTRCPVFSFSMRNSGNLWIRGYPRASAAARGRRTACTYSVRDRQTTVNCTKSDFDR